MQSVQRKKRLRGRQFRRTILRGEALVIEFRDSPLNVQLYLKSQRLRSGERTTAFVYKAKLWRNIN